jgi:hypothetical protein
MKRKFYPKKRKFTDNESMQMYIEYLGGETHVTLAKKYECFPQSIDSALSYGKELLKMKQMINKQFAQSVIDKQPEAPKVKPKVKLKKLPEQYGELTVGDVESKINKK